MRKKINTAALSGLIINLYVRAHIQFLDIQLKQV
jgi:hypothetical protein